MSLPGLVTGPAPRPEAVAGSVGQLGVARVSLLDCALPTARGGGPELLPAGPATNAALSHTRGEELWPQPSPARGTHRETSPPRTEDKIDAKEPNAEAIQEF